jgi:hypothetical protein
MKWTLVISWLQNDSEINRLDYLRGVSVVRDNWFPEWAEQRAGLRYKNWKRVGFYPRKHKGATTETLPILFSRFFPSFGGSEAVWQVSGGVSGGRASDFAKITALRQDLIRRTGGIPGKGLDLGAIEKDALTTLRGTEHKFRIETPKAARMTVSPKLDLPQQATHGQLRPGSFEQRTEVSGGALRIETSVSAPKANVPLGEFVAAPTKNGFREGHLSRDLDAALSLGRELSASKASPQEFLSTSAPVDRMIVAPDATYVQIIGSKQWFRLEAEASPTAIVPKGADARVADVSAGAKSYQVADVPAYAVLENAAPGDYLIIPLSGPKDKAVVGNPPIRGPPERAITLAGSDGGKKIPPPGGRTVSVAEGSDRFPANFDGQDLWIKMADLPEAMKKSPERLHALIRAGPPESDLVHVPVEGNKHPAIELLEQGRFEAALKAIESDPLSFRAARDRHHARTLESADRLLAGGKTVEAWAAVETGERVSGATPELLFRRGLAELRLGHDANGIKLLTDSLHGQPRASDDLGYLLDEINRRMHGPQRPNPADCEFLVGASRTGVARHLVIKAKTKANIEFGLNSEHPTLPGVKAKFNEVDASPADAKSLDDSHNVIYLDDSLRAGTADLPASARRKAIHEAVSGGTAELFELHEPDPILASQPMEVMFARLKTAGGERRDSRFRPVDAIPRSPFYVYYRPVGIGGSLGDNDDDDEYYEELETGEPPSQTHPEKRHSKKRTVLLVVKKEKRL